jgi:hypothetical protein
MKPRSTLVDDVKKGLEDLKAECYSEVLSTIKDLKVAITLKKVTTQDVINSFDYLLLTHEQHAIKMIDEWKKSDMHGRTLNEWRGYLKAIQTLKGEVKR